MVFGYFSLIEVAFYFNNSKGHCQTLTCKLFFIPSLFIISAALILYFLPEFLPLPQDRVVIAITEFQTVSKDELEQAKKLKDKIISELMERQKKFNIKIDIKNLKDTIDCTNDEGEKLAKKLGKQNRAHFLICGKVRIDEDYFFEPVIINLMENIEITQNKDKIKPLYIEPTITVKNKLDFKRQKVSEIADFISFIFGIAKYKNKRYKETIDILKTIKEKTAESLGYMGMAEFFLKNYTNALLYLNQSLERDKSNPYAWSNKSAVLLLMCKCEEALTAIDTAIKIKSDEADFFANKGTILFMLHRYKDSITVFDKAIEIDPSIEYVWNEKGNALLHLNRYEEALKVYDRAIELNPKSASNWSGKASSLQMLRRLNEALICYDKAIEIDPSVSETFNNMGNVLSDLHRYEDALKAFNRAIELNPKYDHALYNKGNVLFNLKRYEESLTFFERAIALSPNYADAWNNKSGVLLKLHRGEEALEASRKAVEIDGNDFYIFNLGNIYVQLKRYDESIAAYKKVIKLNPKYAHAWYNLACVYALKRDKQNSIKHLLKAINFEGKYKEKAKKEKYFEYFLKDKDFQKILY